MAADAKKFYDLWVMNENEAKELLFKAVAQDRLIHEQQLGLEYQEPDLEFTTNVGPVVSESEKNRGVPALVVVKELMSLSSGQDILEDKASNPEEKRQSALLQKFSPNTIKAILELLCDESGFLVESKLLKLLAPLEKDDQSLMKLDAIFSALHVENEDDIFRLATYFTEQNLVTTPSKEDADKRLDVFHEEEEDREIAQISEQADAQSVHSLSNESMHTRLIDPNDCLKHLRSFVEDVRKHVPTLGKQPQFKIVNTENRDSSDDAAYWQTYTQVIDKQKEKLWDALVESLEKYSDILKGRANLLTETDALRTQNAELRMLLHQYINSKVNTELEIPPTRVLQLDMTNGH